MALRRDFWKTQVRRPGGVKEIKAMFNKSNAYEKNEENEKNEKPETRETP
jgi:hypothetical protein